jgi:hypothetical protein
MFHVNILNIFYCELLFKYASTIRSSGLCKSSFICFLFQYIQTKWSVHVKLVFKIEFCITGGSYSIKKMVNVCSIYAE